MVTKQSLLVLFTFCIGIGLNAQPLQKHAAKVSYSLDKDLASRNATDSIDVVVSVKDFAKAAQNKRHFKILSTYEPSGVYVIRATAERIKEFLNDDNVQFADAVKKPKEELTTGYLDLSVNKINYVHARFPQINGSGILASIKEQRFDTTDIDFSGRYINTGVAAATTTSHASTMATTLAGAGNSSPFALGAAPAASITSSSFTNLLPDADDVFKRFGITVQNHSYGTAVESYYGADAAAYDRSALNNPTLLHVFSAGNSGTASSSTGTYAGMPGFANLTGNFKQSKNTISVGAIDSFYHVSLLSSKGPAHDGRVKPELVAFGEDGSSGAAAIVSGTSVLVQQAYKNMYQQLPTSAAVKSVLINSADDVGEKGIDYASGYGSANGYEAVKTILDKRVFENVVANGEVKNFNINVPANAANLKVTIVWTDAPALANAEKALVNDIDLTIKNATQSWQPWVLNNMANSSALLQQAVRKTDTLNNVEQVTVENPAAGSYVIEVKGSHIQTANQSFAIAWQIDTTNYFEWTYPAKEDGMVAAQSNVLRWQTNMSGRSSLYYTINNTDWNLVTDTIDIKQQYYKWVAPDTLSLARVRMDFSSFNHLSDTFVISKILNLRTGFNCADSFLLYWKNIGAHQYQVYSLNADYLEPQALVNDTVVIFNKQQHPSIYYSVAPLVNGRTGMKSFILNYTGQGTECYAKSFYLKFQEGNKAVFAASLGSLYNVASVSLQKLVNGKFENVNTVNNPSSIDFTFTDAVLTRGLNIFRVQILLKSGSAAFSNDVSVYYFPDASVIVYPNPAAQNQPVNIVTNLAGRMKVEIYNVNGALIKQMQLTKIVNSVQPFILSKGIYIIKTISDEGKMSSQKLVVY